MASTISHVPGKAKSFPVSTLYHPATIPLSWLAVSTFVSFISLFSQHPITDELATPAANIPSHSRGLFSPRRPYIVIKGMNDHAFTSLFLTISQIHFC